MVRPLGHGAMGSVYVMRQVKLDRLVAVKVVRDETFTPEACRRFQREARVLASVSHDAIIAVYEAGMDGNLPYMVSEYVEGQTLAQWLEQGGPRSLPQALRLMLRMLDGLKTAHLKGIIHRDLKPSNIFLTREGRPKIGDFGLAKEQMNPSGTSVGKIMGTPPYMSPEQCHGGTLTVASDIYAVGVILFEILAGHRPFPGPGLVDYLTQHTREAAPSLRATRPDLPEALDAIVARALEKDPARRFRSAGLFRKALLDVYRTLTPAREATPSGGAAISREPSPEIVPGTVISKRYELVRTLGQGGMGQVWLARDTARHGAQVALKLLPPELWRDPEARSNLVHEANLALKLAHPNIVRLINLEPGDAPFLVMEFVPGPTLAQVLADRKVAGQGPLPPDEALSLLEDLAAAVDFAHSEQVIHRDIKPSNIIIQEVPGSPRRAKLADFGIAAEVKSFRTRITGVVPSGTLAYMSPEQVACQRLDNRADLYALAATLYQMITLAPPFNGGDLAWAIQNAPVPEPLGVPETVARVLYKGLSKRREERFNSAGEMVSALRTAIEGLAPLSTLAPATLIITPQDQARARGGSSGSTPPATDGLSALKIGMLALVVVAVGALAARSGWIDALIPTAGSPSIALPSGTGPSPVPAATTASTPPSPSPPSPRSLSPSPTPPSPPTPVITPRSLPVHPSIVPARPAGSQAPPALLPRRGLAPKASVAPLPPPVQAGAPARPSSPIPTPIGLLTTVVRPPTLPPPHPAPSTPESPISPRTAPSPSPTAVAGEAILAVDSNPTGAEILVDGKVRGRTPLRVSVPDSSEVRLLAQQTGYKDEVRYVRARAGKVTQVWLKLALAPVSIAIESVPSGATVINDSGRTLGQTPCSADFAPGRAAKLRFELKGYKAKEIEQVVTRGMEALVGRLEPEGASLTPQQSQERDALVAKGEQQLKAGDARAALDAFSQALTIDNTNAQMWRRMAIVQYRLGLAAESMASIRQAYALGSGDATVLNTYANMLLQAGDVSTASTVAQRAAQLSPRDVHILDTLGQTYEKLGRRALAIDAYKQALAVDAGFARASEAIQRLER